MDPANSINNEVFGVPISTVQGHALGMQIFCHASISNVRMEARWRGEE